MLTAEGYITIVQEQRFRLATAGGQVLLLPLAHTSPVTFGDLIQLRDSGARVRVTYSGEANTAEAAVHGIELA